jgi:hypothetical protein
VVGREVDRNTVKGDRNGRKVGLEGDILTYCKKKEAVILYTVQCRRKQR